MALPQLPLARLPQRRRRHRSSRLARASSSLDGSSSDATLLEESRDLLRRFWKVID